MARGDDFNLDTFVLGSDQPGLLLEDAEARRFSVEASDLGLPVGRFPQTLGTSLGNGRDFYAYHDEIRDGDLLWVDYLQGDGGGEWPQTASLRIWND